MQTIKHLLLTGALACACASSMAAPKTMPTAPNPLSVHVLDLQSGQPAPGIGVTLERRAGEGWRELASGTTDAQGRIPALYPQGQEMQAGDYRIVFKTGEHYARRGQASFFPRIPVEFTVSSPTQHYHVPLLLSPFGYSTYRGN